VNKKGHDMTCGYTSSIRCASKLFNIDKREMIQSVICGVIYFVR